MVLLKITIIIKHMISPGIEGWIPCTDGTARSDGKYYMLHIWRVLSGLFDDEGTHLPDVGGFLKKKEVIPKFTVCQTTTIWLFDNKIKWKYRLHLAFFVILTFHIWSKVRGVDDTDVLVFGVMDGKVKRHSSQSVSVGPWCNGLMILKQLTLAIWREVTERVHMLSW